MKPSLFASPETMRELSEARAAAILVGGYDGSGNYGDIALLDAALELIGRLGPSLAVFPLLERNRREDHRAVGGEDERASRALYFDPGGEFEDDLQPVAAPAELAAGAIYLYGGGYLNSSWGERKLAMLGAAEALLTAGTGGSLFRISSGLQVEPAWIAELEERDAAALRSFDFLSARDGASVTALDGLDSTSPARLTGDDAVGVLGRLPASEPEDDGGRLRVNVHFAAHEWVSERPSEVLDSYAGTIAELGRVAGRPAIAQPLIAYLDRHVDERLAVESLTAACSALGIEVDEPLVLRPDELAAALPRLTAAQLTLSCSYHVALTSLMVGVPATLLSDTPYYAQKASGLSEDFELPPIFTAAAGADPAARARELAGPVLEDAAEFRRHLAAGADRLRRRRAFTEAELLGRLGAAAIAALGGRVADLNERLRERAAEPAELHYRLAELEDKLEEQGQPTPESPLEAELRAEEAEARAEEAHQALGAALNSRTWRMAAPLRRAGSVLRRR